MLSEYDFPGDDIPVIKGSALKALESGGEGSDAECIQELMDAIDTYIPEPVRDVERPFLMPVEDVFSITGRGTVATGRIERGIVKQGDEVAIRITSYNVCYTKLLRIEERAVDRATRSDGQVPHVITSYSIHYTKLYDPLLPLHRIRLYQGGSGGSSPSSAGMR